MLPNYLILVYRYCVSICWWYSKLLTVTSWYDILEVNRQIEQNKLLKVGVYEVKVDKLYPWCQFDVNKIQRCVCPLNNSVIIFISYITTWEIMENNWGYYLIFRSVTVTYDVTSKIFHLNYWKERTNTSLNYSWPATIGNNTVKQKLQKIIMY